MSEDGAHVLIDFVFKQQLQARGEGREAPPLEACVDLLGRCDRRRRNEACTVGARGPRLGGGDRWAVSEREMRRRGGHCPVSPQSPAAGDHTPRSR